MRNKAETVEMLERLLAAFTYDPATGFFYLTKTGKRRDIVIPTKGYYRLRLSETYFSAHRAAWAFSYGDWPSAYIDHIDGNPANNSIKNLREATPSQNAINRKRPKSIGTLRGATPVKSGGWMAQIFARGKRYHLGTHRTEQDAHAAYVKAAAELHGDFMRTV